MDLIKLSKSSIGEAEKEAVLNILDQEYLGMGDEVKAFEEELSIFFSRTAVCVNTGTSALQLALESIGVGPGDEVLVPTLTYVASFQAISATGAIPVACDVMACNALIDLKDARIRLSSKTKAIMPVHYAGNCQNIDEIYMFAKKYDLRVIEDAAHAFGSCDKGRKIGSFGDIVCFSFDGIKNITSAEGGCVVSSDENALKKIRDARLLGVVNDTDNRFLGKRSWNFDVCNQGWRYHMSNVNAAIGRIQLQRSKEFFKKRQSIAKLYDKFLLDFKGIDLLPIDYNQAVPHIYVVKIDINLNRDNIRSTLNDLHIQTGIHYYPNHLLSFFKKPYLKLSVAEEIHKQILTLPMHFDMTEENVIQVCNALEQALQNEL